MGCKVPALVREDGTTTKDNTEQHTELLDTFFPPLPEVIGDKESRPQRREVFMPSLTMEEFEEKVMSAKPWQALGEDGLLAMVWKRLWLVIKQRVWRLIETSLSDGEVPAQWRTGKIIPLKSP